jgi:adenylate kinase
MMRHYGIPQVSTGDLLREAVAKGTALGKAAKAAMDAGKLVDDSIVLGMIRQRLARRDARKGFILDGFPRNVAQADALGTLLEELGQPLDAVVLMKVRDKVLFQRLAGRRTCRRCAQVFNVFTNPPPKGGCKGGQAHDLYQRPDDNEQTIGRRLEVYAAQTRPLVAYYRKRGLLRQVDAEGELDVVEMRLEQALGRGSSPGKAASKAVKKAVRKAVKKVAKKAAKTVRKAARRLRR